MRTKDTIRLLAFALISTFTFCALAAFAAQPKEKRPPAPKKLTDITLNGYHLLQPWDEVKAAFLDEATKDPYADYAVPYIADITWEYAGLSYPAEITLRLKGGLVQSISLDVQGSGGNTEMEAIFNSFVNSFAAQGIQGERYDEVIDGIPFWNWSFDAEVGNVWWKAGESTAHARIDYAEGDTLSPITGALGLEFGTLLPDAMLSLPFGRENINVAEDGYSSVFKGEMTATFNTPKSKWPEVFGKDAPGDFTLRIRFLDKKFAAAQVSFGFDEKAYAALQELLAAQYGPPFIDSLSEFRERRWRDVLSHCEITMQMSDSLDAWVEWKTEECWQAEADSLMDEG